MTSKNILVTGPPRCGKSTLIEKVILRIEKPMTGFFYPGDKREREKSWFFYNHVRREKGCAGPSKHQKPLQSRQVRG